MSGDPGGLSRIMEGITSQIKDTRRVFAILLGVMVLPLATAMIITLVFSILASQEIQEYASEDEAHEIVQVFGIMTAVTVGFVALLAALIGLGVRQLILLDRWAKKYAKFRARMDELDRELDDDVKDENL